MAAARAVAIWRAMACSTFGLVSQPSSCCPSMDSRQPVTAVEHQLAHGLGQGLIGEHMWGGTARPWPSPRTGSPRTSTPHLERGWPPAETNPAAPPGPIYMPQYHQPQKAKAAKLNAQATVDYAAGEKAGSNADDYVRTTVYLATVLFLAGIGSHFAYRAIRYGLVGVAGALLVVAIALLATAPKPA